MNFPGNESLPPDPFSKRELAELYDTAVPVGVDDAEARAFAGLGDDPRLDILPLQMAEGHQRFFVSNVNLLGNGVERLLWPLRSIAEVYVDGQLAKLRWPLEASQLAGGIRRAQPGDLEPCNLYATLAFTIPRKRRDNLIQARLFLNPKDVVYDDPGDDPEA